MVARLYELFMKIFVNRKRLCNFSNILIDCNSNVVGLYCKKTQIWASPYGYKKCFVLSVSVVILISIIYKETPTNLT